MEVIQIKELEFHQLQNLNEILHIILRDKWESMEYLSLRCKVMNETLRVFKKWNTTLEKMRYCNDWDNRMKLGKRLEKDKQGKLSLTLVEARMLQEALLYQSVNSLVDSNLIGVHENLSVALVNQNLVES